MSKHDKVPIVFTLDIMICLTFSFSKQDGSRQNYGDPSSTVKFSFFPSMIFCGEAAKKTSIDGLKWRDLVMGRWWLVNFDVSAVRCPLSGVTKGFMC